MKITVAGAGYVGLSNAILLAQNNEVIAMDIIKDKVDMINNKKSPIIDTAMKCDGACHTTYQLIEYLNNV